MLSNKEIVCPEQLIKLAKTKGPIKVVIVNAGKAVSIESTKQAVEEGLIDTIFIGDQKIIEGIAKDIKWDISNFEIIHEPIENNTAPIAAKMASEGKVKIIVNNDIKIPDDSSAKIASSSLLGGNFLNIIPGTSEQNLGPNDVIYDTTDTLSFTDMLGKFIFSGKNK